MATKYTPASDVRKIAEELIEKYHPHLQDVRIEYVMGDKAPKSSGKEVWGFVRKVGSLPAYLASDDDHKKAGEVEAFFVMVISEPVWEKLNTEKRTALIDHELCHCGVEVDDEGNGKLTLIPHDLEEFTSIVRRYGLWRDDVRDFINTAKPHQHSEMEDFRGHLDELG